LGLSFVLPLRRGLLLNEAEGGSVNTGFFSTVVFVRLNRAEMNFEALYFLNLFVD